jgi:hypothetical protein
MSILCELFVADEADALRFDEEQPDGDDDDLVDDEEEPARGLDSLPLGGLTSLEFETLWAIVESRPWSPTTHSLEPLREPEEMAETWLFRFPPPFVARLARLTEAEVAAVAAKWARTEEVKSPAEEIEPLVESIVGLARSAIASNLGLYMWGSL